MPEASRVWWELERKFRFEKSADERSLNGAQWWKFQKHVFSSPFWDQTFSLDKRCDVITHDLYYSEPKPIWRYKRHRLQWTVPWQDIRKMNANALGNGLTLVHLGTRICNDVWAHCRTSVFWESLHHWKLRAGTWNKQKALKRKIILKNYPLGFILFFGECNPGPLLHGSHIFEINLKGPIFFPFNPGCACHGPFAASSTLLCTGLTKPITLLSKRNRNNNFLPMRMRSFYSGLRFGLVVVLVEGPNIQKFTTSFHPQTGPRRQIRIFRSRWRYKRISDTK